MTGQLAVVLWSLIGVIWGAEYLSFPPGFKFGAATAAYQVEGAWNVSDKGESIWDTYTHTNPKAIKEYHNGDVACDSYHLWERDLEMASELGLHFYRFSISWSRLLPTGYPNNISEDGKRYYNNLIDGLLERGIEPMVTLFHWDLPQPLQLLDGLINPDVSDWFVEYARVAYTLFGDRVKLWITVNEPVSYCDIGYNNGAIAPGIINPDLAPLCTKNMLMSHAKAWRLYDEEFKPKYHGQVSLANNLIWFEPYSQEDEELAELAREYYAGLYSHAIYSNEGGWPPTLEKVLAENREKGYTNYTLPAFTQEEIDLVRGTFDFYAMNHYTTRLIRKGKEGEAIGPWPYVGAPALNAVVETDPSWPVPPSSWLYIYPEGIRRQLVWLKKQYGDIRVMITENGLQTESGLDDQDRIQYSQDYMKQIILAINEDGVEVTHYTAWALMDNFEWSDGYTVKYGLYEVDFSDPERTRTPRASADFYASLIKNQSLREEISN